MKTWRRSEPRVARPFFAVGKLESALDSTRILLGEEEQLIEGEAIQLNPVDFANLQVAVLPELDSASLRESLGDVSNSVSLVLTLRDPMFKRRVLHESWPLSRGLPDRIPLNEELVAEFGHGRELQITLALCIDRDLDLGPGWPSWNGSWISRRRVTIKLRSIQSIFALFPMDEEKAKKITGSPGALIAISYDGPMEQPPEEGAPIATCHVAEDVYNAMQRPKGVAALQSVILAEIVAGVITAASEEIREAQSVQEGSPLETILKQLGGSKPMELSVLKKLITEPNNLRAAVHDSTALVSQLRSL